MKNKKTDALIKTLEGVDKVAVIHDNGPGGVNTVAFVECCSNCAHAKAHSCGVQTLGHGVGLGE